MKRYFAYVDREKKEWDFSDAVSVLWKRVESNEDAEEKRKKIAEIKKIYDFLPRSKQGDFIVDAVVRYDSVVIVDPEGDSYYRFPHVYVDFAASKGPYAGTREYLKIGDDTIEITDEWKRVTLFKDAIEKGPVPPSVREDKQIILDAVTFKAHFEYKNDAETLYAMDDRYAYLKQRAVVPIAGTHEGSIHYLRVTNIQTCTLAEYLRYHSKAFQARQFAARQIGRAVSDTDSMTILEVERVHPHEWERGQRPIDIPD